MLPGWSGSTAKLRAKPDVVPDLAARPGRHCRHRDAAGPDTTSILADASLETVGHLPGGLSTVALPGHVPVVKTPTHTVLLLAV